MVGEGFDDLFPLGHKVVVFGQLGHFTGKTQSVVPQGVDFHLTACARGHGLAVHDGIHPSEGFAFAAGVDEPVVEHLDIEERPFAVGVDDGTDGFAIFLPDFLLAMCVGGILLHGTDEPQRRVHRVVGVVAAAADVREKAALQLFQHRVHDLLAELGLVEGQRESRQRDEGVAAPAAEPRVARDDLGLAVALHDELLRRILQTVEVGAAVGVLLHLFLIELLQLRRVDGLGADGEVQHTVGKFHVDFAGIQQIFHPLIATLNLFFIFKIFIPDRSVLVIDFFRTLEINWSVIFV